MRSLFVVLILAAPLLAQSPMGQIEIGQPFPKIQLPLLDSGKLVDPFELFEGRKTVLVVFASW